MRRPIQTLADIDHPEQPVVLAMGRARAREPAVVRSHRHERGQALLISTGLLTVQTKSGSWVVPAGHTFWIPPDHEHSLRLHGNLSGYYVYVARSICAGLPRQLGMASTPSLLREAVARVTSWAHKPASASPESRVEAIVLDEIAALPLQRQFLLIPTHPRLARLVERVIAEPAEARSLDVLADTFGLSRRTITRHFVQETGLTFSAWRQRLRLLQALDRLAAGISVTDIAFDLGYESPSAFTAMFRRHFGTSPSRFTPHGPSQDGPISSGRPAAALDQ
ncbi:AraC-type DNA-binding protein [Enhydrobacter aerosaccus]|uniref:AraC-type DNA-binding protein n=1 Tax=Enhydrobacter aerosaccus TaxID=225324 RepID=A0A1T4KP41_9HYPH|nr:helix-turn-helix transcriptional regulator [Enhydrobacter aerosaccus]SJZ44128.1 AraC-type DNA-binding protein [Enhydrobacter aerosaccus]